MGTATAMLTVGVTVSDMAPKLITQKFTDDESLLFTRMMTLSIVLPEAEQLHTCSSIRFPPCYIMPITGFCISIEQYSEAR